MCIHYIASIAYDCGHSVDEVESIEECDGLENDECVGDEDVGDRVAVVQNLIDRSFGGRRGVRRALELQLPERQTIDEEEEVRSALPTADRDRHLAHKQKVIGLRILPIDNPHPLAFLPAALLIRISDRGPGIKDLPAILGGSYVSPTGMGVGLAGSRRLMDRFDVESAPGGAG